MNKTIINLVNLQHSDFLKLLYNIESLDDGFIWLKKNSNIPLITQSRVLNSLLHVFGIDNKYMLNDDIVFNIFRKLVDKYWKYELEKEVSNDLIKKILSSYYLKHKSIWKKIYSHIEEIKIIIIYNLNN